MNLKRLAVLVAGAALIFDASAVRAEDPGSFYLAPEVSYVLPTDGDVDDTIFLGARAGYNIDHNWGLEIESGWMELGVDTGLGDNLDIQVIPIMMNARYNMDACEWGSAYFFGGVGATINDLEEDLGTDVDVDDSVAWQVGLGAKTPVAQSIDAFVDVRYMWNEPDINETGPLSDRALPADANLQAVFFTAGVEF